jgi:4,5:9,10-diseco-3-hydroxy-5,9,17-trioxoandrosta-1(10),2-diene-4-oate hydrolase
MSNLVLEQKWLAGAKGKICYFLNKNSAHRPTLVFLHGLSANHTTWDNIAEELNKFQLNVLLPDLRGHGHSDKSKKSHFYKIPVFTEDLKNIASAEGLSSFILVGYSFGGYIAMDYALKYPADISSLVLISASHTNPLKYRYLNFLARPIAASIDLLGWLFYWQKRKKYYYFNQDTDLGYWRSTLKGYLTMPLAVSFWMLAEAYKINFSQTLSQIACPTLIIKSQADLLLTAREARDMARKIKSARIITLDEPSHFLASRYQKKILEILINFLKNLKII